MFSAGLEAHHDRWAGAVWWPVWPAHVAARSVGVGLAAPSQAALDKVKDLASTPRLAPGDYGDLVRAMKKILQKDSIVPVAAAAAEVAAVLAAGLRDAFSSHAKVG